MVKGHTRKLLFGGVFAFVLMAVSMVFCSNTVSATQFDMSIKSYMTVDFPSFIFIDASPHYGGIQTADASLRVSTNEDGYTVLVTADGPSAGEGDISRTSLVNTSENALIPTLTTSKTKLDFPVGYWGFSIDDGENYRGMTTYDDVNRFTLSSDQPGTSSVTNFKFGVKIDDVQPAGVYNNVILITAVANVQDIPEPSETRAKALLGNTGHLVFVYDNENYEVGDPYINSYTSMTIDEVYDNIPLFPTDDWYGSLPWLNNDSLITSVDFESSFEFFKPISTKAWFYSLSNLTSINGIESLNTSRVSDMSYMFYGTFKSNSSAPGLKEISKLDVSNVVDMSYMFAYVGQHGDSYHYNTSNDSHSGEILSIGHWDVSNVENMSHMFDMFGSYNQSYHYIGDIGDWDTSNVRNMSYMFTGLYSYDGGSFNISETDSDRNYRAGRLDLHKWDVGNVTNMEGMFASAYYNTTYMSTVLINVDGWDVRNVTDISNLFSSCGNDTTIIANNWKLDSVVDATNLFNRAGGPHYYSYYNSMKSSLTVSLRNWSMGSQSNFFSSGSATFGSYSVSDAKLHSVSIDARNWDISNVNRDNLRYTFNGIGSILSLNVSGWDVSGVTVLSYAFSNNYIIDNLDVSGWNVGSVTNMEGIFSYSSLKNVVGIEAWNTHNVTNMKMAFYGGVRDENDYNTYYHNDTYNSRANFSLTGWDVSNVLDMSSMFENSPLSERLLDSIEGWNPAKAESMASMFRNSSFGKSYFNESIAANVDFTNWSVSKVSDMSRMFDGIMILGGGVIDLSNWDTSSLSNIYSMFGNIHSDWNDDYSGQIYVNLSNWDVRGVSDMSWLFGGMVASPRSYSGGTTVGFDIFHINLSGWDTSNVVHMDNMFSSSTSIVDYGNYYGFREIVDGIANLDTHNVESMSYMFKGFCTDPDVWNYDFSNWDTRKVTDMSYMFKAIEYYEGNYWEITKNVAIDLSSLDTSAVLNMSHMFEGAGKNATSFSLNLSGFDTSNVQNMSYMLYGMGKNASSLSVNISGWNVSNVTNHQYFSDRLEIIQPNWP